MGYPKNPAAKIVSGSAPLQVKEERKKYVLDYFLSVLNRQTKAKEVTQQPVTQPLEEASHFLFESRRFRATIGADGFWKRQTERGFWCLVRHLRILYIEHSISGRFVQGLFSGFTAVRRDLP
jgi:hypothetical protein